MAPPAGSGRGGQRGCIHGGGTAWCLPTTTSDQLVGDQWWWLGGRPGPGPLAPGPLESGFSGSVLLAKRATVSCNKKRQVGTFPPWPPRDGRTLGPFAVLRDTLAKAGKTPAPDSPSWALSPGLQVASVPLDPSGGCWPSCLLLCSETQATSKTVLHLPDKRQEQKIPAVGGTGGQVSRPASRHALCQLLGTSQRLGRAAHVSIPQTRGVPGHQTPLPAQSHKHSAPDLPFWWEEPSKT